MFSTPQLMIGFFPWHQVAPLYSQPHRVYHDLLHIHALLRIISKLDLTPDQRSWMEAVAWLHDSFYDVLEGSPENEKKSASLLQTKLGSCFTDEGLRLASTTIVATAYHEKDQEGLDPLTGLFLDVDLANIGGPTQDYLAQSQRVSAEQLKAGRTRQQILEGYPIWAKKMLARKHLYYSPVFYDCDAKARENLQQVIHNPHLAIPD